MPQIEEELIRRRKEELRSVALQFGMLRYTCSLVSVITTGQTEKFMHITDSSNICNEEIVSSTTEKLLMKFVDLEQGCEILAHFCNY